MLAYCQYVLAHPEDSLHRTYHDKEYGFPLRDDNQLFERFMLEINQAGLSWTTILKKADNFRLAYHAFDVAKVAAYEQADIDRLLADAGIIRNRLKVNAAVTNARRIRELQDLRDDGYSADGMRELLRDMIANLNGMYHVMAVRPDLLARAVAR